MGSTTTRRRIKNIVVVLECGAAAAAGVCAPSPADKLSVDRALVEADGDEKDLARILDVDASVLAGGDKTTLRQRAERAVACSTAESRRFVVVSLAEAEALRGSVANEQSKVAGLQGDVSALSEARSQQEVTACSTAGTQRQTRVAPAKKSRRRKGYYVAIAEAGRRGAFVSTSGSFVVRSPPSRGNRAGGHTLAYTQQLTVITLKATTKRSSRVP